MSLLTEGRFTKEFAGIYPATEIYDFLDKPAKTSASVSGKDFILYDEVRAAMARLNKMYVRNVGKVNSDPFLTNFFKFLLTVDDAVNDDPSGDLARVISWKNLLNFVFADGDRFKNKGAAIEKRVEEFLQGVKVRELKKLRSSTEYKTSVKAALEVFAPKVAEASNGQYDVIIQRRKNSAPVLVDNVNKLQITARNYNEWLGFTKAENVSEFVTMIKNTFDSMYGRMIGSDTIPAGTSFNYNSDALVACDFSKLRNEEGDFNAAFEGGYRKISSGAIVHFVHDGLSLKSKSDMQQGLNTAEGESRYYNEISKNKETVKVSLNTNENFASTYLNKEVPHYIFEIVIGDGLREYVALGEFQFSEVINDEEGNPAEVVYTRVSPEIPRIGGSDVVREAEEFEEAIKVLAEHGYGVKKGDIIF